MIPKLRAWDKQDERMRTVSSINFAHEVISCKFAELKPFDLVDEFSIDDVILMQSTGLKDKNGVEIYEGDILKLHAIFLAPDDKIGYLEYSPKYGYSIIFEGNRLYRQEYWASTNKLKYEVIGNIYENPELLEGAAR